MHSHKPHLLPSAFTAKQQQVEIVFALHRFACGGHLLLTETPVMTPTWHKLSSCLLAAQPWFHMQKPADMYIFAGGQAARICEGYIEQNGYQHFSGSCWMDSPRLHQAKPWQENIESISALLQHRRWDWPIYCRFGEALMRWFSHMQSFLLSMYPCMVTSCSALHN